MKDALMSNTIVLPLVSLKNGVVTTPKHFTFKQVNPTITAMKTVYNSTTRGTNGMIYLATTR